MELFKIVIANATDEELHQFTEDLFQILLRLKRTLEGTTYGQSNADED